MFDRGTRGRFLRTRSPENSTAEPGVGMLRAREEIQGGRAKGESQGGVPRGRGKGESQGAKSSGRVKGKG